MAKPTEAEMETARGLCGHIVPGELSTDPDWMHPDDCYYCEQIAEQLASHRIEMQKLIEALDRVQREAKSWHEAFTGEAANAATSANQVIVAEAKVERAVEGLREIAKGEGEFSRDPLEHAGNCIDSMKQIANETLEAICGEPS